MSKKRLTDTEIQYLRTRLPSQARFMETISHLQKPTTDLNTARGEVCVMLCVLWNLAYEAYGYDDVEKAEIEKKKAKLAELEREIRFLRRQLGRESEGSNHDWRWLHEQERRRDELASSIGEGK